MNFPIKATHTEFTQEEIFEKEWRLCTWQEPIEYKLTEDSLLKSVVLDHMAHAMQNNQGSMCDPTITKNSHIRVHCES